MKKKQRLQVWISSDLHAAIMDLVSTEGQQVSPITEELLAHAIAHKHGQVLEQQSLPALRAMVATELRKVAAQLRTDLREDLQLDLLNEIKSAGRRSDDRLAALLVRALRESGIARRMVYALLAKLVSPPFASQAYEDAREKTGKDLATRPGKEGE